MKSQLFIGWSEENSYSPHPKIKYREHFQRESYRCISLSPGEIIFVSGPSETSAESDLLRNSDIDIKK